MARTKRKVNPVQPEPVVETAKGRTYRTGGYVRLSIEDSGKPGADTIEAQKALIFSYIEQQTDMQYCGLFCDNGRTGTNFERPAFEQLMDFVRTGKIDCIVVKDLSRFGRNYKETGIYLERIFPFLNVRFVAITDHFDTLTAERTQDGYIVPLKNMINEAYSKDISRKSSSALATKQQNGDFIGSWAPYGYQKCAGNHNRIEPNEETAPVVRQIFQWRIAGVSYPQIVRQLNSQGIPSPSRYHYLKGEMKSERAEKALWHVPMVKKILLNEVYLGHMVQRRFRSGYREGKKLQHVPQSDWVIVRNTHQAIIDQDTFTVVQQMSANCRMTHQERMGRYDALGSVPNILRGLVSCADCKCLMIRYKNVSVNAGNRYYCYICRTHAENPTSCPKKNLHETVLKEILWDTLRHELILAGNMEPLMRQYERSQRTIEADSALEEQIAAVVQRLDRAKMLHESLYNNYVNNLMTEQEYMELKQQYLSEIRQSKQQLEELEQKRQGERRQTIHNSWLTACGRFQSETELTEEMVHTLVERIEVDAENHVSIKLKYQDEYQALVQILKTDGKVVPA